MSLFPRKADVSKMPERRISYKQVRFVFKGRLLQWKIIKEKLLLNLLLHLLSR